MKNNEKKIIEILGIVAIAIIIVMIILLYPQIFGSTGSYRVYERRIETPVSEDKSYTSSNGSSSTVTGSTYYNSQTQTTVTTSKLEFCPDEKIDNRMPTTSGNNTPREYYIYQGKRYEISQFNATWVEQHCTITVQTVY